MRDVGTIRQYVWDFLDLEEEDLAAGLIDVWILEGWRKIVRRTRRWPFFESEWVVSTASATREVTLASDVDEIGSIEGPFGNLTMVDESAARNDYNPYRGVPTTGRPEMFSLNAGVLRIYPTPDATYELRVVGFRQPASTWMDAGSGAVPDFPDELEDALLAWVMHRAYTHQDDPELAVAELQRFTAAVDEMVSHHIQAPLVAPLVIGGGRRSGHGPWGERPVPWGT